MSILSLVQLHVVSLSIGLVFLTGLNPLLGLVAIGLAVANGRLAPRPELSWVTEPYMLGLWSVMLAVQVIADLYFVPATVQDRTYLDPFRVINAYVHARLQSFCRPLAAAVVLATLPLPFPAQTAAVIGFVSGTLIYWATAWVREHVAMSRGSVMLLIVEATKNSVGLACAALIGWTAPLALILLLTMIVPIGIWAARLRRERILYPPYINNLAPDDPSII